VADNPKVGRLPRQRKCRPPAGGRLSRWKLQFAGVLRDRRRAGSRRTGRQGASAAGTNAKETWPLKQPQPHGLTSVRFSFAAVHRLFFCCASLFTKSYPPRSSLLVQLRLL